MTKAILDKFHAQGYHTEIVDAEPNKVYEPHFHYAVKLHILSGTLDLIRPLINKIDELTPGQEASIEEGEIHAATVGAEGCTYVYATHPEDVEAWEIAHS